MEKRLTRLPGVALLIISLCAGFAIGWWQARERAPLNAPPGATDTPNRAVESASRADAAPAETLAARLREIMDGARTMLQPDAATLAFFETLPADEAAAAFDLIEKTAPSNERDLLVVLTARRWAELDATKALARAVQLENLPLRAAAVAAAYEAWGMTDAQAAFAQAQTLAEPDDRARAFTALLAGAAANYPGGAITLWEGTPEEFRTSLAGTAALDHMIDAACGAGKREAAQAIVLGLPPGEERARVTSAIVRNWGMHEPEAAVSWVRTVTPPGETQDSMVDVVFSAYVRKDPVRAAEWAVRQSDNRRRSNYVAAAVTEWAKLDTPGVETWVNEQPEGGYLDGATYALAAFYLERRQLAQAFAWTRRINRPEARADLLGNLGWVWNKEQPDAFKKFLAETSLNRAEVEMLRSKIINVPAS